LLQALYGMEKKTITDLCNLKAFRLLHYRGPSAPRWETLAAF